jgi:hypothetical protein
VANGAKGARRTVGGDSSMVGYEEALFACKTPFIFSLALTYR